MSKIHADMTTRMQRNRIKEMREWVSNCDNDPKAEERRVEQNCKVCFYEPPRMVFQAFTDTSCRGCGTSMTFSNSLTDKYCESCAKAEELCKHCGGSVEDEY